MFNFPPKHFPILASAIFQLTDLKIISKPKREKEDAMKYTNTYKKKEENTLHHT